jgi:hypothetical protein
MPRRLRPRRPASAVLRRQPGRRARRTAGLRLGLFALLLLGSLLRPMLILACDIHAAAFAHASQPHAHNHVGADAPPHATSEADANDAASAQGHGDHQQFQLGAAAGAADVVASFVIAPPPRRVDGIPRSTQSEPAAAPAGAPFRPPIA